MISTREYQDWLDTLVWVRQSGLKACGGGIVGMGETREQSAGLIAQLANLGPYPESVPLNHLVLVESTPLHGLEALDAIECVRTIVVARITMPQARVRLSAERRQLGEEVQAMSSWRAPIRFSMVTSCSPPSTRRPKTTARCWPSSA